MRCAGHLLSRRQARRLLHLSRATFRCLVASGRVVPVRSGLRRRFRRGDLLRLWAEGEPGGGDGAGVREPRRPLPVAPAGSVGLPLPGSPLA